MPIVRRLLPEDVSAYREIRLEALKNESTSYGSTYEEEAVKTKLAFETYIEQQSSGAVAFGAFADEQLVGITVWKGDERIRLSHRAKIGQVYVKPEYRGRGVGRMMMKAVIEDAFSNPNIEAVSLEVVNTNAAAIHVYEELGFKTYGVFERYFKTENGYLDQRFMVLNRD